MPVEQARDFVDRWLPVFGFGHYRVRVTVLPKVAMGKVWARCHWNHDEEFVNFQFVPDGVLKDPQVEALVLHEMAHGLCSLAEETDEGEERVCNRIARLVMGGRTKLANEWMFASDDKWWDSLSKTLTLDPAAGPMLKALIDELPEPEREVINRRFYERQSLGEIAKDLGYFYGDPAMVSPNRVKREIQKALDHLEQLLEAEGLASDVGGNDG